MAIIYPNYVKRAREMDSVVVRRGRKVFLYAYELSLYSCLKGYYILLHATERVYGRPGVGCVFFSNNSGRVPYLAA